MRVVFAGTPPFAQAALAAIVAAGHDVALVLTQPDRPAGRGLRLTPSAVGEWAAKQGLTVAKPPSLRGEQAQAAIAQAGPDVMVVAAYGLILPPAVLEIPPRGCINIHASLLPRWRGAAPIQRAILAGDAETGISIMQMDAGLDTGAVLLVKRRGIDARETSGTLAAALAALGAEAIVEALEGLPRLQPRPQDDAAATYAAKIGKADAAIDWSRSNLEVDRAVRALDPAPGAETSLDGESLKIWAAEPVPGSGRPGEVLHARNTDLTVACGSGALKILMLQRPGGRRLPTDQFLRGSPLAAGRLLGEKPLASA